jgi:hypothetical protein
LPESTIINSVQKGPSQKKRLEDSIIFGKFDSLLIEPQNITDNGIMKPPSFENTRPIQLEANRFVPQQAYPHPLPYQQMPVYPSIPPAYLGQPQTQQFLRRY